MLNKEDQEKFYKKLGEQVRLARKKQAINQDEVAAYLGLTRISIVNIEQGNQKIQLHSLLELCSLLKLDAGELLAPLYVTVNTPLNPKTEKNLNKEIEQLDNKHEGSEILKGFLKYSKYKK